MIERMVAPDVVEAAEARLNAVHAVDPGSVTAWYREHLSARAEREVSARTNLGGRERA